MKEVPLTQSSDHSVSVSDVSLCGCKVYFLDTGAAATGLDKLCSTEGQCCDSCSCLADICF